MPSTAKDFGVAHFYGLRDDNPEILYMTVQSDSFGYSYAIDVEVSDQQGRVITDRLDDTRVEVTLEGVLLKSDEIPDNGTSFQYNGVRYILKSIDDKGTNKDFRKVSVKGIKYQQINLTA
jgi:hypothetical protein